MDFDLSYAIETLEIEHNRLKGLLRLISANEHSIMTNIPKADIVAQRNSVEAAILKLRELSS